MIEEFEYNGKAMGTEYSIAIVCESKQLSLELYKIGKNLIDDYEKKFSRFLTTSELSLLNKHKNLVVSEEFLKVTQQAYKLFVKTKGIFNPLVQISRHGYNKNFLDIQDNEIFLNNEDYDIDFSEVIIDKDNSQIFLNKGQNLDYGGFLKGYLSEIIAEKIKSNSSLVKGVIVNIGGDIHTKGLDRNGNRFVFSIYNPILKNEDIIVTLYNQSLATSGTYKRTWMILNKEFNHILDKTGNKNPESDIISASIINNNGGVSEAYTKVFLSVGCEKALEILEDESISFAVIKNNGKIIKNFI